MTQITIAGCRIESLRFSSRYLTTAPAFHKTSKRCIIAKSDLEDVYVGGGKIIKDDPKKYPSREDAGFLQGVTGGWAGGEVGFQKFVEEIEPSVPQKKEKKEKRNGPKKAGKGKDKIYVGFDYKKPEDLDAMRKGQPGNFVIDDVSKYPNRDYFGWLPLQGGFAGGEMGLEKFIEEGDIQIAGPNEKGRSQMSPLLIGIFIAAVATTGGVLLTDAIDFGENLTVTVESAQIDDKTKLLLEVAVGLLFVAWGGSAIFAFFKTIREKVDSGTASIQRALVSVLFWCVVLVATYNLAKA